MQRVEDTDRRAAGEGEVLKMILGIASCAAMLTQDAYGGDVIRMLKPRYGMSRQ